MVFAPIWNRLWMRLSCRNAQIKKRMHIAEQAKQVCLKTSTDKRHLTATPYVNQSGEVVCMRIIARRKTARSYAPLSPGYLLHDAVYKDNSGKKVQNAAIFKRLLRKLAQRAGRIPDQH